MNRDPEIGLLALVLILVVGAIAAVVGALRSDRRDTRPRGAGGFDAAQVRAGEWTLVLESAGPKQIQVIKELRAITGLGLVEAKALTDRASSTVLTRVDHASAAAAHRILTQAGAVMRIVEDRATGVEPAAEPRPDGLVSLVLDDPGDRKIQVIKEIRLATGLGLAEAKRLTDRTPSTVLSHVDRATAATAQAALARAGAIAHIAES